MKFYSWRHFVTDKKPEKITFTPAERAQERNWKPQDKRKAVIPVDPGGGTPDRGGRRSTETLHRVKPDDTLNPNETWMP